MNVFIKTVVLATLTVGSVTAVYADSFSNVTTSTADLTFNQPAGAIGLDINPLTGLTAGKFAQLTTLANVTISSDTAVMQGVRWTPGTFTPSSVPSSVTAVVSGNDNGENKLELELNVPHASKDVTVGGDVYRVTDNPTTISNITLNTLQEQQIAADTYTVSLDAAIYNP